MNHFDYRGGVLHAEDVPIPEIAASVGTPFYVYSSATLLRHFHVFRDALPEGALVAYAVKANGNLAVINTLAREGAGADVVSEGELRRALAGGVPPDRIVFSGVGKTQAELAFALDTGIFQINVESEPELEGLSALAASKGVTADIAIRVNPDVDARTHAKISTGKGENKFGVPIDRMPELALRCAKLPGIRLNGIAVHIGSQITELGPLEAAYVKVIEMTDTLRAAGHAITRADFGGGLGVPYVMNAAHPPSPAEYGAMVGRISAGKNLKLAFEPGRLLVANAGILVSRVVYVKHGASRDFLVLDAGMNDLIRPAMYEAHHDLIPVAVSDRPERAYDIVGPVCETGDTFARGRTVPAFEAGELAAILTAGAYGAAQASEYNARPLVPEVMVNGDAWALVRARPSYEEMLGRDRLPTWLG
ncbi:MAG: diaminopimelate decarboxylase [Micropepsaceae bacterium]